MSVSLSGSYSPHYNDTDATAVIQIHKDGYCPKHPDVKIRFRGRIFGSSTYNSCSRCEALHQLEVDRLKTENLSMNGEWSLKDSIITKQAAVIQEKEIIILQQESKLQEQLNYIQEEERKRKEVEEKEKEEKDRKEDEKRRLKAEMEIEEENNKLKEKSRRKVLEKLHKRVIGRIIKGRMKVVLLGEGRVGKTSILLRYVRGEYSDRQVSSLEASYLDSATSYVHFSVWDTPGQERFHGLGPLYYRDADAALLVYDITDAQSFEKVKSWAKELRRICGPDILLFAAGNKCDLKHRMVNVEDAISYCESIGMKHYLVSAKLDQGLDECFTDIVLDVASKKEAREAACDGCNTGETRSKRKTLIIDEEKPPHESGCC
jgi:Ras-related protein Rab-21